MGAITIHADLKKPWTVSSVSPDGKYAIINCETKIIRCRPEACADYAGAEFYQGRTMKKLPINALLDEPHKRRLRYFKRQLRNGYTINWSLDENDQQDKTISLVLTELFANAYPSPVIAGLTRLGVHRKSKS